MSVFLRYLLVIVISYFIGNFAPSYFIGKITKNIDIRDYGSGNAGATNTFRVLGAAAGVIVLICDVLKKHAGCSCRPLADRYPAWRHGGRRYGSNRS